MPARGMDGPPEGGEDNAGHAAKGNRIDNSATEQVFDRIKDEFFQGRSRTDFESFKSNLEAYTVHWNTMRRQARLKELTLEEFRKQPLVA